MITPDNEPDRDPDEDIFPASAELPPEVADEDRALQGEELTDEEVEALQATATRDGINPTANEIN